MVGKANKTGQPLAVNRPKKGKLTRDDLELSLLGLTRVYLVRAVQLSADVRPDYRL